MPGGYAEIMFTDKRKMLTSSGVCVCLCCVWMNVVQIDKY